MTQTTDFPTPQPATPPGVTPEDVPNHNASEQPAPNPWFDSESGTVKTESQEPAKEPTGPSLGTNRKRGGPRQLTKADLTQLRSMYDSAGFMAMMVRPQAAEAIANCADDCVKRWEELAKQNDNVRRMILSMIEGSAWTAVVTAHMPIILACIPERVMENMPLLFGVRNNGENEDVDRDFAVYEGEKS